MATKYTTEISPEVMDVLRRSTVDATRVVLPPGQLDRKLYEAVNKVLTSCGGKWNGKAKAHLFASDPREALGLALDTGSITDERKARQQFFTPSALAADIVAAARIRPGMLVLEPSAGGGAIAREARVAGGVVMCIELDAFLASALRADNFDVITDDFLAMRPMPLYERVVMNPPFANGQDVAHVSQALRWLIPGGRLVAVMGAGFSTSEKKAASALRVHVLALGGTIEDLPEASFEESGTAVRTVLVSVTGE